MWMRVVFSAWLLLLPLTAAHVQMAWPLPLRSSLDPAVPADLRDYDMRAPLAPDGSNFPCKGYHTAGSARSSARFDAGSRYSVAFDGSATHLGGSCQLSLSYDGGASFRVVKSIIGGCPLRAGYDFTVPAFAPSGDALFAWTWLNHDGNREFYMNCAAVEIRGGREASTAAFARLPTIWVANVARVNQCRLPEGTNAVFPSPGPDVEYGDGMSRTSAVTAGDCQVGAGSPDEGSRTLNGEESSVQSVASPVRSVPPIGAPRPGIFIEMPASEQVSGASSRMLSSTYSVSKSSSELTRTMSSMSAPGMTWTTVYSRSMAGSGSISCIHTTESVTPRCMSTMSAKSAMSSMSTMSTLPRSNSLPVSSLCSTSSRAVRTSSSASPTRSVTSATLRSFESTNSAVSSSPSSTRSMTPTSASSLPQPTGLPYAGDNLAAYLPCSPGALLCVSADSFVQCVPGTGGSTSFSAATTVAAGMLCLPFMSTPPLRDDRYVRARPYGSCPRDGELMCADAGSGPGSAFWICDQGGWIDMGAVAAGTTCRDGAIVAT